METKKSFLGYAMWIIYALIVFLGVEEAAVYFTGELGFPKVTGLIMGIFLLGISALIVYVFRRVVCYVYENRNFYLNNMSIPVDVVLPLFVLGIGLFIRINCIASGGNENVFYEWARINADKGVPLLVHGVEYVYIRIAHFIFFVFGNKLSAVLWFQFILQMFSFLLIYFAQKKNWNRYAALITLTVLMFSPTLITGCLSIEPESLLILLGAIIYYALSLVLDENDNFSLLIFLGIVTGLFIYLDISGVAFFLLILTGILKKEYERIRPALIYSAITLAGVLLFLGVDSLLSGDAFLEIIKANLASYFKFDGAFSFSFIDLYIPWEILVVFILLSLGVFTYYFAGYKEKRSVVVLPVGIIILFKALGIMTDRVDGKYLLFILLASLSGIFIQELFILPKTVPVTSPVNVSTRNAMVNEDAGNYYESINDGEDKGFDKMNTEAAKAEETVQNPIPAKNSIGQVEGKEIQENKINFIENPLPLPKKHEKKKLDYDIIPRGKQNEYDIDVPDNDDFDI